MHDLTNKTWRIQTRQIPLLNGQTLWEACLEAYNPRPLPHWYRLGDTITGHTRESVIGELKSHYCHNLTSLWQTEETTPDAPSYAPTFTCHERTPEEEQQLADRIAQKLQANLRISHPTPCTQNPHKTTWRH